MREKRTERKKEKKIYFWERIAFRISAGFLLPVMVGVYALYSYSGVVSEVSETKEQMQRMWNGVRLSDGKAVLTLTKMRMHAQAFQYEPSQDLALLLDGEAKALSLDVGGSRRSLEAIAAANGASLETPIKRSYDELTRRREELSQQVSRLLEASRRQNQGEVVAARSELDRVAREAESLAMRLHAQVDQFEGVLSDRAFEEEQRSNRTLGFYLIAVFFFGIAAAAVVTVSITSPVRRVLTRIRDIATGGGDLTRRVTTRAGGEMTELALWLNVFLDKTHEVISTIAHASSTVHDSTLQVSSHAERMSVAATSINKSMTEQSMNIDECTNRVGCIDDLIHNAGESTRQAASLSKIAMDRALQGGASVQETIEAMEKIEETARKVEELVSSINEIASQTNLLAINAAIEATKAGEHGKGFAVVAEEVRRLAERARKLTGEVTGLVGESSGRVKAGVGLARAAGVSLDGIIKDVEAVASLIQRIAAASAKQTESSTAALEFMQKISEAVRENLREMEGVTKATEFTAMEVSKLDALVGRLNEVVGQFRITQEERADAFPESRETSFDPLPAEAGAVGPFSGANELVARPRPPGELSIEAMMNPQPTRLRDFPPPRPPRSGSVVPALPPLPPGADPGAGEDAA